MAATPQQTIEVYSIIVKLFYDVFHIHVLASTPLLGNKGLFLDENALNIFLASKRFRSKFVSAKAPNGVLVSAADLVPPSPPIVASLAAVVAEKLY